MAADGGYHDTHQLVKLLQEEITPCVPATRCDSRKAPHVQEGFQAKDFRYEPQSDTMTCPAGQSLPRRKLNTRTTAMSYQAKQSDCTSCLLRPKCCPKTKHGRTVNRPLYQKELETVAAHVSSKAGKELAARRRTTVAGEHGSAQSTIALA